MPTANRYRQYAHECIVSVSTDRQAFLNMARKWTQAAMQIEANKSSSKSDDC